MRIINYNEDMGKQYKEKAQNKADAVKPSFITSRLCEGGFILALATAIFVLIALLSYHPEDNSLFYTKSNNQDFINIGGQFGAYISAFLYWVFGFFAYFVPLSVAYFAWVILKDYKAFKNFHQAMLVLRGVGFIFLCIGGCGLLYLRVTQNELVTYIMPGGVLGDIVGTNLTQAFNEGGATLLLFAAFLTGMTWLTGFSWVKFIENVGKFVIIASKVMFNFSKNTLQGTLSLFAKLAARKQATAKSAPDIITTKKSLFKREKQKTELESQASPEQAKIHPKSKLKTKQELPPLNLLSKIALSKQTSGFSSQELKNLSNELEQHLLDFGVEALVVAVHPGPVITRFELQLAAGVKVSKLTALSKDLARSLSVTSVRVVEIIPGKTVVGLELPNPNRAVVSFFEILSSHSYLSAKSPLSLALGVDIAGDPLIVDLAKMPHLLVAGTTGSGKSVGINAMILSILFKASPEQVKLIMVDPKMLELSVYDGIPHLLTPVVTDMKEAASALRWCVGEMERRYRLMATMGVRNIAGFNTKIREGIANGAPITDPFWKENNQDADEAPPLEELPFIVVVIDELADMMMVVGKKVEQLIARIAQKARAAGIHLILATQRPSVDVLTGLIKSNIPTRISFQVSSKIDSRTILDQQGADQLLGNGDMLYLPPGSGTPQRVHGAFVDDKEVHKVAEDWRNRGEPDYIQEITANASDITDSANIFDDEDTEDKDPLYDQVVEFVIQTRKASVSSVQRRFKIGYNRAARLVDEMERTGLVGPLDGGVRDVLAPAESD